MNAQKNPVPQANVTIIWAAFLMGHFIYGFLPWRIITGYEGPSIALPDLAVSMEVVMVLFAVGAAAVAGFLAFNRIKDPKEQFVLFIVQLASSDLISICGFVVSIITKNPAKAVPFVILGVVIHLMTGRKLLGNAPSSQ